MVNLCDTCEQRICSANTKNVVFSDNGDIIKCDKYDKYKEETPKGININVILSLKTYIVGIIKE